MQILRGEDRFLHFFIGKKLGQSVTFVPAAYDTFCTTSQRPYKSSVAGPRYMLLRFRSHLFWNIGLFMVAYPLRPCGNNFWEDKLVYWSGFRHRRVLFDLIFMCDMSTLWFLGSRAYGSCAIKSHKTLLQDHIASLPKHCWLKVSGVALKAEKLVSTGRGLSKVFARLGGNAVVMAKMLMLSITVHHSHA